MNNKLIKAYKHLNYYDKILSRINPNSKFHFGDVVISIDKSVVCIFDKNISDKYFISVFSTGGNNKCWTIDRFTLATDEEKEYFINFLNETMIYKIIQQLKNTKCFYDTLNDSFVAEKDPNIPDSYYKSPEKVIEDYKNVDKMLKEHLKQISRINHQQNGHK